MSELMKLIAENEKRRLEAIILEETGKPYVFDPDETLCDFLAYRERLNE